MKFQVHMVMMLYLNKGINTHWIFSLIFLKKNKIVFYVHVAMQRPHHDQINLKVNQCMHSIYSLEMHKKN